MKKIILLLILFLGINTSAQAGILPNIPNMPWAKSSNSQEEELDPTSEEARILYAQNNIDKALKLLNQKGVSTRTAEDWLIMGNILQDQDKLNEAIYMYKKAIEKNPKYYKPHYNLGCIYLAQERPNMALEELKLAVKYKDDFSYGYYNIGCAYIMLKEYKKARYNLFKAMDIKGDYPETYYNLAYVFSKLGNEKQAQSYLDIYNKMMERQ